MRGGRNERKEAVLRARRVPGSNELTEQNARGSLKLGQQALQSFNRMGRQVLPDLKRR